MRHVFGKSITLSFTPLAGQHPIAIHEILAARIYEFQPGDTQVNDSLNTGGDFVLGTTTAGDFSQRGDFEWTISLPEIAPPETKTGGWRRYYYAVNFRYESGGTVIGQWESFVIYYPDAIQTRYAVYPEDLYAMQSKFEDRSRGGDKFAVKKIELAEELLTGHLNGKNLDRNLIHEEDLRLVLKTWAAALACNDLSSESGDSWEVKALQYEQDVKQLLVNLNVHYDYNGDNVIDNEMDEINAYDPYIIR